MVDPWGGHRWCRKAGRPAASRPASRHRIRTRPAPFLLLREELPLSFAFLFVLADKSWGNVFHLKSRRCVWLYEMIEWLVFVFTPSFCID